MPDTAAWLRVPRHALRIVASSKGLVAGNVAFRVRAAVVQQHADGAMTFSLKIHGHAEWTSALEATATVPSDAVQSDLDLYVVRLCETSACPKTYAIGSELLGDNVKFILVVEKECTPHAAEWIFAPGTSSYACAVPWFAGVFNRIVYVE